jgi:hypothetical protein
MNYAQLTATIEDYTENTFTATELATFVQNAEQRIYNSIQFPALRKNSLGTLTSGNKYLSAPSDFLSVFSLAVVDGSGNYYYLLDKDVNFIREAYPNSTTATGIPQYYAIFGPTTTSVPPVTPTNELSFILGPTPNANYTVELHYFYYPVSMSDTVNNPSGTSWLGDNFDSVLLYGSLLEAYVFMKGEQDLMAKYQQRYDEALALAKQLGDGKNRQDAYRNGQVRYPVK